METHFDIENLKKKKIVVSGNHNHLEGWTSSKERLSKLMEQQEAWTRFGKRLLTYLSLLRMGVYPLEN